MSRIRALGLLAFALVSAGCGGGLSCLLQGYGSATIETQMAEDGSSGTFALSGGCDLCAEGTVNNVSGGIEDDAYVFVDELVCADGSGSIVVGTAVDAAAGAERASSAGEWEIVSGTGKYAELTGDGDYQGSAGEGFSGIHSGTLYTEPP